MRHRSRARSALSGLLLAGLAPALVGAGPAGEDVRVSVTGLRSAKGQVLACLVSNPRGFPDCQRDPAARKLVVPANAAGDIDFGPVAPGRYAIALLHDENGNGKADMVLMMPREGYGFSRDAAVRFGPPSFKAAAFEVGGAPVHQTVRMRYMF